MTFTKISSPTLKQLFINELETMILKGELKIGEKLPPEREIASMMQVSRSVVNDGICELAHMGFLTMVPRQGTFVADYMKDGTIEILVAIMKLGNVNRDYIRSTLELRTVLISMALDTAVQDMTDEQFQMMESICEDFERSDSLSDSAACLYRLDHHLTVCSNNLLLPILFSSFRVPNQILFERYLSKYGKEPLHRRNLDILSAIKNKDTVRAKQIVQESINQTISGCTEIYSAE